MATADKDAHLELKKRARRRLVGATALALLAAIVLPMVMDEEPKPVSPDIQVRIPGKDTPFNAPTPEKPAAAKPETAAVPPSPSPEEKAPPKTVAPPPPTAPAEKPAPSAKEEASQAKPAKPKPPKPSTPETKAPQKPASPETAEEKAPPKKPAAKPAEKPATAKPTQKPAEKPAPKAAETTGAKAAEPAAEVAKSDEARAKAILDGTGQAASPPAPSSTRYVLQLGAFSDADKARKVQARVKAEGYNAYTQSVNTSAGARTRVRAGPFPSREAADKAREKLKRRGLDGIVAPSS